MDFTQSFAAASDAITAKRVFGEPYERDGTVVIPAAAVQGGGGGGGGTKDGEPGGGGGFGLKARPVGAFVIQGDDVSWIPAVDVSRAIVGGQLIALAAIAILGFVLGRR